MIVNTARAKRFLQGKFGEDRLNGNGISRLLEEYRVWIDPTEDVVELVRLHAEENGLITKKRKEELVDQRTYLYVFLTVYHKMSRTAIAKMFGKDHASVYHGLKEYLDGRYSEAKFIAHTVDQREEFYMDTKDTVVKLSRLMKRGYHKVSNIKVIASKDRQREVLLVVDSLIDKYNLKEKYPGDEAMFRKVLLVKVLDSIGWSHGMIARKFNYRTNSGIGPFITKANSRTHRSHYFSIVNEFAEEFRKVNIEI